jgi:hypothetical protein
MAIKKGSVDEAIYMLLNDDRQLKLAKEALRKMRLAKRAKF